MKLRQKGLLMNHSSVHVAIASVTDLSAGVLLNFVRGCAVIE